MVLKVVIVPSVLILFTDQYIISNICCLLLCQPTKFYFKYIIFPFIDLLERKRKQYKNSLVPISYS